MLEDVESCISCLLVLMLFIQVYVYTWFGFLSQIHVDAWSDDGWRLLWQVYVDAAWSGVGGWSSADP